MESHHYTQIQEIPITGVPQTVVSLVPSVTESLFDLNLGQRLIGRTEYCVYPQGKVDAVPALGGTKNPDVERIIAMEPALVIANQEENRKVDVEALRAAGIRVWVTFPKTVSDAFNLLWNMMYLFEETSMVPRIRLIERAYDYVSSIAEAHREENPTTVFVPIWYEPLMTINGDTYVHDLLRVVGGQNVFADRQQQDSAAADVQDADAPADAERDVRYPRLTLQDVEDAQPDVILLPSEPFSFDESHLPIFQALDVPAAKHGRIHLVDGSLLTWHGTRIAYALDALPKYFLPLGA